MAFGLASAVVEDDGQDEWENDVLQLQLWAKLKHAKQLEEEVEGLELTMGHDSHSDASSIS